MLTWFPGVVEIIGFMSHDPEDLFGIGICPSRQSLIIDRVEKRIAKENIPILMPYCTEDKVMDGMAPSAPFYNCQGI